MRRGKMTRTFTLFIMMVVAAMTLTAYAQGSHPALTVSQIAQKYGDEILQHTARGQYREAIVAAAEYEQELISRYQPPTYEMGLLQSETEHVAFHSPFDTWKLANIEELKLPNKELLEMGYTFLLVLKGSSEEERLVVFCVNVKQLERRMGISDLGLYSDQGHQLFAQMLASNFGVVKAQRFQIVGDHRVLFVEINPPMLGPDIRMVVLPHDGRIFVFLLTSPAGDITTNEKRLRELVKTASFTYKPEDKDAIATERANADRKDVKSLLKCIERLANLGEYNAAAEDLAELRLLLRSRMPKVTVTGNMRGNIPSYGVTVKNPDPKRWRLSVQEEGAFEGIILEDKYSVNQEGIMVGVIDFVMAYGPTAVQMMNDEEIGKQMLVSAGRGGAMSLGQIESERFTMVKGNFAYEAIVIPNLPGLKARVQWIMRPGYGVMVFMLGDARNFQAKLAEYDKIIDDYLELEPIRKSDRIYAAETR